MNPTQNFRYRHRVVIEFETSNAGLDDFGRALEAYTPSAARRFAERELRDNAGIGDQARFRIVEQGAFFMPTRQRKRLTVTRVHRCDQCLKRRVCFLYFKGRGTKNRLWFCVADCASRRYDDGWRPVEERA